ncbi:hypothetical protein Tsubulata_023164 [Turnera subulata]|uniref:DUF4283 domain-containing protein n=1 Tax=Turnera subulata TaxID=218843 RepID=A0A9Q0JGY6_9ROSI|nr:hypothetical protein Tsubulata_023164 [Turnera subulata]
MGSYLVDPHLQQPAEQIFIPKDGGPSWLKHCVMGILKSPIPIHSLNILIRTNIGREVSIIPTGGVSFLIKFDSAKDMDEVMENKPTVVDQIFSSFKPFQHDDAAKNRLCWVLMRGIPPSVWNEEFFKVVAARCGLMVDCSNDTRNRKRMDVAEVLVLTTDVGFINRVFSVEIGSKTHKIGVFESQFDPLGWEWSSTVAPDVIGKSDTHSHAHADHPILEAVSCPNKQPGTHAILAQITNISGVVGGAYSQDPFNLDPIIKEYIPKHALPSLSPKSLSSKPIPSELAYSNSNTDSSEHLPTNMFLVPNITQNNIQPILSSPSNQTSPTVSSPPNPPSEAGSHYTTTILSNHAQNHIASPMNLPLDPFEYDQSSLQNIVERKVMAILKSMQPKRNRKTKFLSKTGSIMSTPESRMSITDSDIGRMNQRATLEEESCRADITVSFTEMEAVETCRIGDQIGWGRTQFPEDTLQVVERLVENEVVEW